MSSQRFDKIGANSDILIHIFNLLDIEDQLRLAQVNYNTRHVFENFIWVENYRSLAIYEYGHGKCFEVTNKTGANRLLLREKFLQEFLTYYGKGVQDLIIDCAVANLRFFTNLTCLKCILDEEIMILFLKQLAESVPQLEILEWKEESIYFKTGIAIDSEVVECLMQMTNLKQIYLRTNCDYSSIAYEYLKQIMSKGNLQVLKLEGIYVNPPPNKTFYRVDSELKKSVQLKELDICPPDDFWKLYTGHFENLAILRLCIDWPNKDNRDMKEISIKCPNLERLSFYKTDFIYIEFLKLPSKLSELNFQDCYSLNCKLLKKILTQTTIKIFTSHHSYCYENTKNFKDIENFEPFEISPLIHTLAIDGIDMSNFQLQLQLQHLRKFYVNFGVLKDWCYLSDLLKHPPLRELHLSGFVDKEKLVPISVFPIKMNILIVEFVDTAGSAFEFFLDLFSQNPDLKLSFSIREWTWMETLKLLLNHQKCPNDLEIMQVCDFQINCKHFMMNFEMAAKKFRCAPYNEYVYNDRKDSIVLYRHF